MTRTERIYAKHYADLLELNKSFILAISRPQYPITQSAETGPKLRKKLTKKQLQALAKGRKKLAAKRGKLLQI